jgi:hypothetical protein
MQALLIHESRHSSAGLPASLLPQIQDEVHADDHALVSDVWRGAIILEDARIQECTVTFDDWRGVFILKR